MANLGVTPVQVVANAVHCGRCGAELGGDCAGADVVARYLGPVIAAVSITEGTHDKAKVLHRCPPEGEA